MLRLEEGEDLVIVDFEEEPLEIVVLEGVETEDRVLEDEEGRAVLLDRLGDEDRLEEAPEEEDLPDVCPFLLCA